MSGNPERVPQPSDGDARLTCDSAGRILEATPSACDFTGYSAEELLSRSLKDLGAPPQAGEAVKWISGQRGEPILTVEAELRRKDGRSRPVRLRLSRDPREGSGRAVVSVRHRRRAAETLGEDEGFVLAALQAAGSLLAVLDRADRVLFLNRGFEELIGRPSSDARGKRLREILLPTGDGGENPEFEPSRSSLPASGESDWHGQDGRRHRISWRLSTLQVRHGAGDYLLLTGNDVTALRAFEQGRDAVLVRCCGDALFSKSLDGIVTSWNPAAEQLYGYSADEMIGRPVSILVPPERSDEPARLIEQLKLGHPIKQHDSVRIRKDGARIDVSLTIAPIRDAAGRITGAVVAGRDLSERRRFEHALEESERHLRHLLDEMPLALWTTDQNLVITTCAGRLVETGPVKPARLCVGHPLQEFFPPDSAAVRIHREALGSRPGRYSLEIEGHVYDTYVEPRTDPENRIVGTVAAAIDVTGLRRAEESLRESERRLHKAEAIARAGSWEWDVPAQTGTWSPGLYRLLGVDPDKHAASLASLLDLVHPADREGLRQRIRRAIAEGVPFHTDFRLIRAGKELTLLARGEVLRDDAGRVARIAGTVQDVTERKQREAEISTLNLQLEERVRHRTAELEGALKEMETYTYAVAHDLRAPLRALHGLSDILLQDYGERPLDPQGCEYLEKIAQAARRMDSLIQDLLSYAQLRREEIPRELIDLRMIVFGVIGMMSYEIQSRGARIEVGERTERVLANPLLVGQAILNLISNAIKFVSPGIVPEIGVRIDRIGENVRLSVADNGIGIAPEHTERIFGVFERLNRAEDYPGTGMGLAIARRSVERMGGSVGVRSTPGKGSTFWIEFPAIPS